MKPYNFKISYILIGLFLSLFCSSLALAEDKNSSTCAAYLVAEADSGEILESNQPDLARPPASMAKLMTAYVVYKKIKEGNLNLEDLITISADASKVGGSQVYLKQGEIFSVNQLLNALLIQSANDAALALAQHISGSRDAFVEEMNTEAQALGMTHAVFHSPHGLPPGKDQLEDSLSPSDFLILARALIHDFPQILEITSKQVETFRDGSFEMRSHNGLLRTFAGTDGLKTGFYNEAGFCVTATAERKNIRLIAVLMGCPSRKIRDELATELLTKSFNQYKNVQVVKAGEAVGAQADVEDGIKSKVDLSARDEVKVSSRVGKEKDIERKFKLCDRLVAPVTKGTVCGLVEFSKAGQTLGSSALLVTEDVEQAGFVKRMLAKVGF